MTGKDEYTKKLNLRNVTISYLGVHPGGGLLQPVPWGEEQTEQDRDVRWVWGVHSQI